MHYYSKDEDACGNWSYHGTCLPSVDASTVISTPRSLEGLSSMSSYDVEWSLMWTLSRNDIIPFCLILCGEGKGKIELKDQDWESIYTAVSWQSVPPYYYSKCCYKYAHNYHTEYSPGNSSSNNFNCYTCCWSCLCFSCSQHCSNGTAKQQAT